MDKISKSSLVILGLLLSAGNVSAAENGRTTAEAAQAVRELVDAGVIKVNSDTGAVALDQSVLLVLKRTGFAEERAETRAQMATGSGGGCMSPQL